MAKVTRPVTGQILSKVELCLPGAAEKWAISGAQVARQKRKAGLLPDEELEGLGGEPTGLAPAADTTDAGPDHSSRGCAF